MQSNAIDFTSKTWSDTATSGTAITANDLNRLEKVITSLTNAVNMLNYVSDWLYVYQNPSLVSFIKYKVVGKIVYLHWYFDSCKGTKWTCPTKLPTNVCPAKSFSMAGACSDLVSNNVTQVRIESSGLMSFNDFHEGHYSEGMISWILPAY